MRPELIADRLFVKYLILLAFANTVRIKIPSRVNKIIKRHECYCLY